METLNKIYERFLSLPERTQGYIVLTFLAYVTVSMCVSGKPYWAAAGRVYFYVLVISVFTLLIYKNLM